MKRLIRILAVASIAHALLSCDTDTPRSKRKRVLQSITGGAVQVEMVDTLYRVGDTINFQTRAGGVFPCRVVR